jgi:hypothetical protein
MVAWPPPAKFLSIDWSVESNRFTPIFSEEVRRMKRIHGLGIMAAMMLACGSNNSAVSRNEPGTGTSTLKVTGDIDGSPSGATFTVVVKDGLGNDVSGATVAVMNPNLSGGELTLTEAFSGSTGEYGGATLAFPSGDFRLSVIKGSDYVQGVVVGGPGVHTINAPAVNSTVAANQPLDITWTTPMQSKQASVSTRDMSVDGADIGAYTIAASSNPARTGQRVTVERQNEVDIAGGLLGSRLRVTYSSSIDPFNVQ